MFLKIVNTCFGTEVIFLPAPSPSGVCALRDNVQATHRSCRCKINEDDEYKTFCKDRCHEDNDCKGYSYWLTQQSCDIYTDSSDEDNTVKCPIVSNEISCVKLNLDKTGPIATRRAVGVEGCFIKETRKFDDKVY